MDEKNPYLGHFAVICKSLEHNPLRILIRRNNSNKNYSITKALKPKREKNTHKHIRLENDLKIIEKILWKNIN